MRARTNISLKPRYTATLGDFKGVDLNTSPLRVATSRASFMKNFICDNGVNHKRPGWEEQFCVTDENDKPLAVHGIFPFDENGTEILLVHAGEGIYRAEKGKQKWAYDRLDNGSIRITEERSQCFYRGGRAFIIGCGNYLVYGEFDGEYALKEVAEIAYVPTTTIGIGGSDEVQETLDAVNLLTRKRKNTAVGKTITWDGDKTLTNNGYGTWKLDGISKEGTVKVEIEGICSYLTVTGDYYSQVSVQYELSLIENNGNLVIETLTAHSANDPSYKHFFVYGGSYVYDQSTTRYGKGDVAGCVNRYEEYTAIHLYFGAQPLIDNQPNITITFDAATDEAYDARRVQDCGFGVLFGANGADDRLFLAGNDRYPNADIWSEWDDFTYFPDGNTMEVGGGSSAITAYARLSDTTLAVMKEEKAGEPTIFYRTGRERTEEDGITLTQWFPVSAGISGDGAVNHHAGATLSGDVLTLTREGVHALVLSANVASGERYTRERSRPIYRELARAELATAAGIVYRNRYYLALPGTGKCYVADAHYKATFEGSTDYNYEWWVWENVPAACFAEYKDQLIFGTPEGRVCAFTEGVFLDKTHIDLGSGDFLDEENGAVIYGARAKPLLGDRVVIYGNVYIRLVQRAKQGEDPSQIRVEESEINRLYVGQTVLVEGYGEFEVKDVDADACAIRLVNGSGGSPAFTNLGFAIYEKVDGRTWTVCEVNENEKDRTFLAADEKGTVFFAAPGEAAEWTGRYIHEEPVCAEWITPIMDLGTNAQSKSLVQMTVATEPGINGSVTFGYETRRILRQVQAERAFAVSAEHSAVEIGGDRGFSFDDLDFNSFSFDTAFAHSYTKRVCLRNFNFIQFKFGSDTDEDCAVSGVTLVYKINQNNRGVR